MSREMKCIERMFAWVVGAGICLTVGTHWIYLLMCGWGVFSSVADFANIFEDED